jgi:hypothetical protein
MKTHLKFRLPAFLAILCLLACGKSNTTPDTPAIQLLDKLSVANNIAKLWKNGVAVSLTDGSKNATGNSVYVVNNNVYIAGYENNGTVNVAKLWKNGVPTALTDGSKNAQGNSVFVSGSDVYVAGYEYDQSGTVTKAVLWKNGIANSLTDGSWNAMANSVFVNGNDVYVAGYFTKVTGNTGIRVAVLWKNGVIIPLSDIPSTATSIYITGNDMYVAGYEVYNNDNISKLWKNGTSVTLAEGFKPALANSVFVSNNDIYVVGLQSKLLSTGYTRLVTFWKNNEVSFLTDGTTEASGKSVFVSGNDVYIAGYQYSGTKTTVNNSGGTTSIIGRNIAKLWKNGMATSFTDGTKEASANSVFVSGSDVYVVGFEAISN